MKTQVKLSPRCMMALITATVLCGASATSADEPPASPPAVQQEPAQPEEAGDVQERGLRPKVVPGGVLGGTHAPPPRMVGPTDNLTQVANAFSLRQKSLTTLVTVSPGLRLTQSVEISIGYYSPAGTQRITQSYVAGTGNRFLYNDNAGDGKQRRMRVDISLREPKPVGGVHTFSFPMQVDLDPLYDVAISPFKFSLISKCDAVGKSEIGFKWYTPDDKAHGYEFSTSPGPFKTIDQFSWTGVEVSTSHLLHQPSFWFRDRDPPGAGVLGGIAGGGATGGGHGFDAAPTPSSTNLVPGKTQTVKGNRKAMNDNCESYYEYTITYILRWYSHL